MANKNTKTYLSNDELFKIIEDHSGDAQKISKEASINLTTLKKHAYDISLATDKLVVLTNFENNQVYNNNINILGRNSI